VSTLGFLTAPPDAAGTLESALARALHGVERELVEDRSFDCKIEVRGDLDLVDDLAGENLVRLTPRRGMLFTTEDAQTRIEQLRARGVLAYDFTGALAGLELRSERAMRRLTDLDLERLPTAGPFARVSAIVLREDGERFRVYVPQELGHYVAEAVLDVLAGLENV
jgi:hypothetical protein